MPLRPEQSLEIILEYLGKALNGERTYILKKTYWEMTITPYEWVANGIRPEKDNLQNVPAGSMRELVPQF